MKSVLVRKHGGPEVLEYIDIPKPEPGPGQVRVRLEAIGINRRDGFIRAGIYKRELPLVLGIEGAGTVDALGPGVTDWRLDQRVAYYVPDKMGAYAEYQSVPAGRLVELPDGVSYQDAAAIFDHGLTAHYLTTSTFPVRPGHRVLVQAAAGGVGALLVQLAKRSGATVYGTVSSTVKAKFIRKLGIDAVIPYREVNVAKAIAELTDGQGVHVVYDSVGKDTIEAGLSCLARRGMLVLYGQSSGPVTAINPAELADRGSLFFTRPHLLDHIASREELCRRSAEIFGFLRNGELSVAVQGVLRLADAAEAHRLLEDRSKFGKLLLIP